ncbi:MAG: ABC transporter ATP-binding protein/permease [Chitinispirillales bacterium]|jgi:subfamily B ATP-binding cassette protein MsbA|nr:ABC transporter ATP-binding protein/permease [Chitinispirillales bacterium]
MTDDRKNNPTSMYSRTLHYMRPYWWLFIISFISALAVVLFQGISGWFLGTLPSVLFSDGASVLLCEKPPFSISNINEWLKYHGNLLFSINKSLPLLVWVSIIIAIAFTVKNIFLYINNISTGLLNFSTARDMRNDLFGHILKLPTSFYDQSKSGSLMAIMVNDLNLINSTISNSLGSLLMEPLKLLGYIAMLFIINAKLTLILFVVYPVLILVILKIGNTVKKRSRKNLASFDEMVSRITEVIGGVRAVKMFNMAQEENTKFKKISDRLRKNQFRQKITGDMLSPLTETLAFYLIGGLLILGGNEIISGEGNFSAEDFTRFLVFMFASYQPLKTLGNINSNIQAAVAAAQRVFKVFDSPIEKIKVLDRRNIPQFNDNISFNNVSFAYESAKNAVVLDDLSFTVKKGDTIALVGGSGAGKSTILDIIPRFYEIDGGEITLDGKNISDFELTQYRELFSIVSQETILFNASIKENIAYGKIGASDEEIIKAAKFANAYSFIVAAPQSFDTMVGERGVALSGGQKQRIAIARAILRNSQILILDEATSALDTESESLVQEALSYLMKGRTTFVAAHRLSTIRSADTILVLEKGKLVESGNHEELLAKGGRYNYLHSIQFSGKKS